VSTPTKITHTHTHTHTHSHTTHYLAIVVCLVAQSFSFFRVQIKGGFLSKFSDLSCCMPFLLFGDTGHNCDYAIFCVNLVVV
jgi:hypothetical protein